MITINISTIEEIDQVYKQEGIEIEDRLGLENILLFHNFMRDHKLLPLTIREDDVFKAFYMVTVLLPEELEIHPWYFKEFRGTARQLALDTFEILHNTYDKLSTVVLANKFYTANVTKFVLLLGASYSGDTEDGLKYTHYK